MVETALTDEDKRNLKVITEEIPKLRLLVEELVETIEILSDKKLMQSIKVSEKDAREGRLLGFRELLKGLGLN